MSKKITKTMIDRTAPEAKDVWLWDGDVEGFGVRIRPTGRKTYVIRYRNADDVQRKMTIGRCSDFPPETARDLARKEFAKVAAGEDPAAERRPAADSATTVEKLFQAHVANMRTKGRASADEVERALLTAKNNAADALGRDTPCGDVTPQQVVAHLADFYKAGHRGAADKQRSYIAAAYTWGVKSTNDYTAANRQDWGIKVNPGAVVAKDTGAVGTRDRNLDVAELRALWLATAEDAPGFSLELAACIRVLIGCGQRVQETLRIDGAELDFKECVWRIPAHKTKGGKHAHTVPLPRQVLPTLQRLVQVHGQGALFPARTGAKGDVMDHRSVMQAIERFCARSKAVAFQTRDIRRTWKSRAHDAGVDRFTRDLIQQHAKHDTGSKHYDRAEYLPQMREAMGKWADWIDANLQLQAKPTPAPAPQPLAMAA